MSTDQVMKAALELSERDRAKLAEELLASLDGPADRPLDEAWIQEIERRSQELRSGKVNPIPAKEAMRQLRERYS
jgi:putative addiction module component (TIGR02574 family)